MINMQGQRASLYKIQRLLIALAVLFNGSAVVLSFKGNLSLYVEGILVLLALTTVVYKYNGKISISRSRAFYGCVSVLFIVLISTILNISTFAPTVGGRTVLTVALAFLLICLFDSGEEAIEAFVSVSRFFAITGFIFWLVFIVFGVSHSWMPTITSASSANVQYSTIYIYNISNSVRNCGVFWEPSIYAGFLVLGMVCSRFFLKQQPRELVPFVLALFSSQSSGGIIMLVVFLVICLWDMYGEERTTGLPLKILVILLMIAAVFLWDGIQQLLLQMNYDMFSKIFRAMDEGNSETRLVSFLVDLQIWREAPILGVGTSEMEVRFLALRDAASLITNLAHTSTSTEYIAAFGLGGIWINWLWLLGLTSKHRSIVLNIGIVVIFFVLLNLAPQINFVFPYFILFALLRMKNRQCRVRI